MVKAFLFLAFYVLTSLGQAQNLVSNGGFETYTLCPTFVGQIDRAIGWVNPNNSSPDYMNTCATSGALGVPNNYFGNQQPHGGNAYAGIILFFKSPVNFREYLQTRLVIPLQNAQCYHLEMYVNLGESVSRYTTDDFGVYFSVSPLLDFSSQLNFTVIPQVVNTPGNYPDLTNWKVFAVNYYAGGGEEFITIGNFKPNATTNTVLISPSLSEQSTYMYVDDVSLTPCIDVGLPDEKNSSEGLVFPTRFTDQLNAKVRSQADAELTIYKSSGETMIIKKFNRSCSIETNSWPADIYFYQLRAGMSVVAKGKLIKE